MIKHCDYPDPDEQDGDRLVVGLRDRQLKGKLQPQSDLTSENAITMARQRERIKQRMKAQTRQFERLDIEETTGHRGPGSGLRHDTGRGRTRCRGQGTAGGSGRRVVDDISSIDRSMKHRQKCGYERGEQKCPAKSQHRRHWWSQSFRSDVQKRAANCELGT